MDQKHHENETTSPHSPSINLTPYPNVKTHHQPPPHITCAAVVYRECQKNHAAAIGGHAVDGCGEFMPSPTYTPTQPSSYKCAACGCHRNFHRLEPTTTATTTATTAFIHFHRPHQPSTTPSPPSPPPQPPTNLILSLTTPHDQNQNHTVATPGTPVAIKTSTRKRFRTKFSQDQKQKMQSFAEKVGWKLQRCDDKLVLDFCNEIGIKRGIFKVWMHNNKNTLAKKDKNTTTAVAAEVVRSIDSTHQENGSSSSS